MKEVLEVAVLTKDDLLERTKQMFDADTRDAVLAYLGDFTDTINAMGDDATLTALRTENEQLKQQMKEQDEVWRKKYKEAFFSEKPEAPDDKDEPDETPDAPKTFSDLFEVK